MDFFRSIALAVVALLPIINPPGSAPIFLSMTPGASDAARVALARRIATSAWMLLVGAMLVGSYVLSFFGLSLAVIKIAGGLLVISTGWHLISADATPDAALVPAAPAWGAEEIANRSFYPLTFPLTIGPGSVSVAMAIGANAQVHGAGAVLNVLGGVLGAMIVAGTIYLSYRYASRVLKVLGESGTVVLLRLSAFILLSVGVQILCDGLAERFQLLK